MDENMEKRLEANFKERMDSLLKKYKLSIEEFEKDLESIGIGKKITEFYNSGKIPPRTIIKKICSEYKIESDYFYPGYAAFLQDLMENKSVTYEMLERETGIPERVIRFYESAERVPNLSNIFALADFFGVSVEFIINYKLVKKDIASRNSFFESVKGI